LTISVGLPELLRRAFDNVMGLAFLKGKLYATGGDGTNDFLQEIDPAAYEAALPKANVKDVFRSRGVRGALSEQPARRAAQAHRGARRFAIK
jgi:hypothetical protein